MSEANAGSTTNVFDIDENKKRQIKNIQAFLSKFHHINLIGGLPTRYESAFYHQKAENRVYYEIDTHDASTVARFISDIPRKGRNYHVSLGPVTPLEDPDPSVPKCLVIIDLDINHEDSTSDGIDTYNKHLKEYFPTKETFAVRTKSGGLHLYYYAPLEFIRKYHLKKVVNFMDGVDILSSDVDPSKMHSAIGPGSYSTFEGHINSGKTRYAIDTNAPIQPLPTRFMDFLAKEREQYTSWHKEELAQIRNAAASQVSIDEEDNIKAAKSYVSDLIIEANEHYKHSGMCKYAGRRNDSLNRIAYHIATFALSESVFEEICQSVNDHVFRNPLTDEEFTTTIKSALAARVQAGETSINAEADIPDFAPITTQNITYSDIIPRARLVDQIIFDKLQGTKRGLKILTSTMFQTESHTILAKLPPLDRALQSFQRRLELEDHITYAELTTLIRDLEMRFVFMRGPENVNNYIGPVDVPSNNKQGRPKKASIMNHPYFQNAVRRGVDISYNSAKENIIEDGELHPISPPPLSLLPSISEEEYQKQLPFVQEILEHFRYTVTDPKYPEEFDYLLNFIAAMCQGKQIQAFIVLHGPQGTGKSQFLKFMSLFVPQDDLTIARNPNAVFEKFANIGTLTTIDDCNLNETRELDALKARVSDDTHVLERKFMQAMTVRKIVSIAAATNHLLTDLEFLHERRLIWFSSGARYSGPEYLQIVNNQCRRLLANGGIALAALHRYFQEFKITIRDWNFNTHAHLDLIQKVEHEQSLDNEGTNKWRIAKSMNVKDRDRRDKEKIAVANLIANFGYVSPSITNRRDVRVPLITPFEDLQDHNAYPSFTQTSPDWLYMLRYFHDLKDGNQFDLKAFEQRLLKGDPKILSAIRTFTQEMNKHQRPFADVVEEVYSPASKKCIPRIADRGGHSQKRLMVLTPVVAWLPRFSVLANGSVSAALSFEMLKKFGLEPAVDFLQDQTEEPTKEECQKIFNQMFPGETMGEYNVVRPDVSDDFFEEEEDEEESSDFTQSDT